MMEKKNKMIDKFIKEGLEVENTSLDFSKAIMQDINASELEKEKVLRSLLQKYALEQPSVDFTSKVLSEIKLSSKTTVYQPVISKRVWAGILSVVTLVVFYVSFFTDDLVVTSSFTDAYLLKLERMFSFHMPDLLTSPLFALSIFALSSLLFLDYFLKNRKIFL